MSTYKLGHVFVNVCPSLTLRSGQLEIMSSLPVLLPSSVLPQPSTSYPDWKPRRYLSDPQPPPLDDNKILEAELANARQMIDGKLIKKTRPRRTVDYNGGMGRWLLVRRLDFRIIFPRNAKRLVAEETAT